MLVIFNVDYTLYHIVHFFTNSFWVLFFILAVLGNIEIPLWYKFWRWFITDYISKKKEFKETVKFTKELGYELKYLGYFERIKNYFRKTFEWALNPNRWIFRILKAGGYVSIFFLGCEPFLSGGRLIGVISCATARSKLGLVALCVGNTVHIYILIWQWKAVFYAFSWVWHLLIG